MTKVLTLGAGVQWFEAYAAAQRYNRIVVGGISLRGSVGAAGGWLQGGGHSPLSPNYGLGKQDLPWLFQSHSIIFIGVDNVLEITIVTADGNHVIANPYRNKDLFWALRGGGGGTWGVVTSVTYKTHPSTPFYAGHIFVNSTNANSTLKLFSEIIRLTPSLVTQGYGGFSSASIQTLELIVLSPNVSAEQNNATFLPLFEFAHSLPGLSVENATIPFQDWWEFNSLLARDGQVGVANEISSWLLPKDVVQTDKPEDLAQQLLKISGLEYL